MNWWIFGDVVWSIVGVVGFIAALVIVLLRKAPDVHTYRHQTVCRNCGGAQPGRSESGIYEWMATISLFTVLPPGCLAMVLFVVKMGSAFPWLFPVFIASIGLAVGGWYAWRSWMRHPGEVTEQQWGEIPAAPSEVQIWQAPQGVHLDPPR